jgi:hypothetical protein
MSTPPKRPKTVNRLQQLITEWERESGQPVRRLNLRVASIPSPNRGEPRARPGRLPAHIRRTWPAILAAAHHNLPRLERPLCHHGQQPRHADHRPLRSSRRHPRVHPRDRHKLKTRIFSRSCPSTSSKLRADHQLQETGARSPRTLQHRRAMSRTHRHHPGKQWPPIRFTALNRRRRNARIGGRGEIAQLVEHSTENRGVGGSSPPLAIASFAPLAIVRRHEATFNRGTLVVRER